MDQFCALMNQYAMQQLKIVIEYPSLFGSLKLRVFCTMDSILHRLEDHLVKVFPKQLPGKKWTKLKAMDERVSASERRVKKDLEISTVFESTKGFVFPFLEALGAVNIEENCDKSSFTIQWQNTK